MNMDSRFSTFRSVSVMMIGIGGLFLSVLGTAATINVDQYATWGIASDDPDIPVGSVITDATLTIYNISASDTDDFDIYLLENPRPDFSKRLKQIEGSEFEGFGTRLVGAVEDGNFICRLGHIDNNDSQSHVWNGFTYPFNFNLADGRTITYTSALLELIDYVGTSSFWGFGFESAGSEPFSFSSIKLTVTVSSYTEQTADQIITYTYISNLNDSELSSVLHFDGKDDSIMLDYQIPVNNFTLAAWVKTSVLHQIDEEGVKGTGGFLGQKYLFAPEPMGGTSSTLNGGVGVSVGTNGISVYEYYNSSSLPAIAVYKGYLGTGWNHIVITYEERLPRIYLNGILVHVGLNPPRNNSYAPFWVGGRASAGQRFNGEMVGLHIWDRTLSDQEVLDVMCGASVAHPVGQWLLNEGSGTTAFDSSGNGYDSVINGAEWISPENILQ